MYRVLYEAIEELNKAMKFENDKKYTERILEKFCKIYYYSGNNDKFNEILDKLKKINPKYQPAFPKIKNYAYYIPIQVEDIINEALTYYKSGNFDAALDEFLQSLEVKETAIANRCIGDILFTRNDSSAFIYYLKAYPGYKNNVRFLHNLGLLYLQNGQTDKAWAIVEEIKKLDPEYKNVSVLEESLKAGGS